MKPEEKRALSECCLAIATILDNNGLNDVQALRVVAASFNVVTSAIADFPSDEGGAEYSADIVETYNLLANERSDNRIFQ